MPLKKEEVAVKVTLESLSIEVEPQSVVRCDELNDGGTDIKYTWSGATSIGMFLIRKSEEKYQQNISNQDTARQT